MHSKHILTAFARTVAPSPRIRPPAVRASPAAKRAHDISFFLFFTTESSPCLIVQIVFDKIHVGFYICTDDRISDDFSLGIYEESGRNSRYIAEELLKL